MEPLRLSQPLSQLRTNNWAIIYEIGASAESRVPRRTVANVALPELLEQRGLSEGRCVANVVDGKGQASKASSVNVSSGWAETLGI